MYLSFIPGCRKHAGRQTFSILSLLIVSITIDGSLKRGESFALISSSDRKASTASMHSLQSLKPSQEVSGFFCPASLDCAASDGLGSRFGIFVFSILRLGLGVVGLSNPPKSRLCDLGHHCRLFCCGYVSSAVAPLSHLPRVILYSMRSRRWE